VNYVKALIREKRDAGRLVFNSCGILRWLVPIGDQLMFRMGCIFLKNVYVDARLALQTELIGLSGRSYADRDREHGKNIYRMLTYRLYSYHLD
jgi:hypothetical protein